MTTDPAEPDTEQDEDSEEAESTDPGFIGTHNIAPVLLPPTIA